mgnify:CR=1 FL=1
MPHAPLVLAPVAEEEAKKIVVVQDATTATIIPTSLAVPIIVCVLPAPVAPYAKMVELIPDNKSDTSNDTFNSDVRTYHSVPFVLSYAFVNKCLNIVLFSNICIVRTSIHHFSNHFPSDSQAFQA